MHFSCELFMYAKNFMCFKLLYNILKLKLDTILNTLVPSDKNLIYYYLDDKKCSFK